MSYNPGEPRDKDGQWTTDGIPKYIQDKTGVILEDEAKLQMKNFKSYTEEELYVPGNLGAFFKKLSKSLTISTCILSVGKL